MAMLSIYMLRPRFPLFYIGAFYLLFSALLTFVLGKAEKKLSYFKS